MDDLGVTTIFRNTHITKSHITKNAVRETTFDQASLYTFEATAASSTSVPAGRGSPYQESEGRVSVILLAVKFLLSIQGRVVSICPNTSHQKFVLKTQAFPEKLFWRNHWFCLRKQWLWKVSPHTQKRRQKCGEFFVKFCRQKKLTKYKTGRFGGELDVHKVHESESC